MCKFEIVTEGTVEEFFDSGVNFYGQCMIEARGECPQAAGGKKVRCGRCELANGDVTRFVDLGKKGVIERENVEVSTWTFMDRRGGGVIMEVMGDEHHWRIEIRGGRVNLTN